jgi:putative SOS response-associated peptidase YedK
LTERSKVNSHYPEKETAAHQVSTLVNNPKFDDPRCVEPVR